MLGPSRGSRELKNLLRRVHSGKSPEGQDCPGSRGSGMQCLQNLNSLGGRGGPRRWAGSNEAPVHRRSLTPAACSDGCSPYGGFEAVDLSSTVSKLIFHSDVQVSWYHVTWHWWPRLKLDTTPLGCQRQVGGLLGPRQRKEGRAMGHARSWYEGPPQVKEP